MPNGNHDSPPPAQATPPDGWMGTATYDAAREPVDLRTGIPHPARIYDYLLGGKTNFAADRAAAEQGIARTPGARLAAHANRGFLRRAVTYLTQEAGIRQFLDVGTGLPTSPNVHEIAQAIAPQTRVVYTDNDPIVLVHARALLTSPAGNGPTSYIQADLRDPQRILTEASHLLDFTQPVGLLLIAVTHHLPDADDPHALVAALVDGLPPGSYLALSQITDDLQPAEWHGIEADFAKAGGILRPRPRAQIEAFFTGLDLVEPGLTLVCCPVSMKFGDYQKLCGWVGDRFQRSVIRSP